MNNEQKQRTVNSLCTGITLPWNILQAVDTVRKDVPRSRFILRAIENYLQSGHGPRQPEGQIANRKVAPSEPKEQEAQP